MKGWILKKKENIAYIEYNSVVIINATPHDIRFRVEDEDLVLPPSGYLLNAKPCEERVRIQNLSLIHI